MTTDTIVRALAAFPPVDAAATLAATPTPPPIGKAGWRAHADAVARRCPPPLRAAHARMLEREIVGLARTLDAPSVAIYAPIGSEVDTRPLANALLVDGRALAYPRLLAGPGEMEFAASDGPAALRPRPRSRLLEPIGPAVPLETLRLIVAPALAVDHRLTRLGRNGGYYDRTLATRGAETVVVYVCLHACVLPWGPVLAHDQAADLVLTEHGLFAGVAR